VFTPVAPRTAYTRSQTIDRTTIGITAIKSQLNIEGLQKLLSELLSTTDAIPRELGYRDESEAHERGHREDIASA